MNLLQIPKNSSKFFERSREHENLQKNHERTGCSRKDRPCDLHTADPGADCGKRISRKVIHRSWSFTEELVVAVFVLITLLAAALACREGELVSLTLVTDRLPKKLKKPSVILITVLSIIFSVILFKYGMDKVITQLQNGKRTFVLNWPEWIFWSFVPIGAGCMILHFIEFCLDFCCKTNSAENADSSTKSNMNTITTDKKEGK